MSKLRGFKFVTTLVLEFKKIESEDKTKYDNFYSRSKAETIINEIDIDDAFQSIHTTIIYQTYKNLEEKVQTGLLIQSLIIIIIFQSIIPSLEEVI